MKPRLRILVEHPTQGVNMIRKTIRTALVTLAFAVVMGAALGPAASAHYGSVGGAGDQGISLRGSKASQGPINPSTGYPVASPVEAEPQSEGFDWPSPAVVGATAGGVLLLVVTGTVAMGRRGRGPLRPRFAR
jgi:hypothetical protein